MESLNNCSLNEALTQLEYLMGIANVDSLSTRAELAYITLRLMALMEELSKNEMLTNTQKLTVKDIALDFKLLADGLVVKEKK